MLWQHGDSVGIAVELVVGCNGDFLCQNSE